MGGRGASRLRCGLRGVLNVQMIGSGGRLIVIEANPRASRTVPIVAKAPAREHAWLRRCALRVGGEPRRGRP